MKRNFVQRLPVSLMFILLLLLFHSTGYATMGGENGTSGVNKTVSNDVKSGDPIYTGSGSVDFRMPLLDCRGLMGLSFTFIYNRAIDNWWGGPGIYFPTHNDNSNGPTNYFWFTPYSAGAMWHEPEDIHLPSGDSASFKLNGTVYELIENDQFDYKENGSVIKFAAKATYSPDRFWVMDPVREQVHVYELYGRGKLLYTLDRNGNKLSYTYRLDNRLDEISDGLGRKFSFTYTTVGSKTYLETVSDQTEPDNPRTVAFAYEESAPDMGNLHALRSITDALGNTYTLRWQGVTSGSNTYYDNLVKVENPKGPTYFHGENTWDYTGYKNAQGDARSGIKVVNQKDPYDNETTFAYNYTPYYTQETTPDDSVRKYYHNNAHVPPSRINDPTGKDMNFTKDANNRLTSVTDRMVDTTTVSYHAETGKVTSMLNNKGDTITYTYVPQNQTFADPDTPANTAEFTFYNLTRIDYPDGTNEQFTYDARGNRLTRTDRNGKTRTYTYNDRGQVLTITNPLGGVTTYTYNADATPASATNSDTGTTTYEYDAYKRLKKIIHPNTTFVQMAYDLNTRITSVTDELDHVYTYAYDANGNLISITDPANKASQYAHDLMDRVNEFTNRLGKKSQLAYDNMNRLKSATDPNGNKTQYAYNSRGWMDRVTDAANKVWQTGYDDEGLSVSRTTPLNLTTTITRDKLGYVTGVTDPLDQTTTLTRDTMSRITAFTNPMGRQTTYGYDGNELLTSVTLPVVGTAQYTRNDLGLLSNIQDLKGSHWTFAHTDMGRLASMTDPLTNQWQYAYDPRGRLNRVTYPGGATQTRTLDAANNVTAVTYSEGPTLNYTYDELNRLLTADSIAFTYNDTGQVTATTNPGTTFGATYDDGGRILTATYAGLFSATYEYDSRNRLSRVSDSLTSTAVQFTHDDDGRLTAITRSSGANTAFTLDDASCITRIQHGALADLQYAYNGAGEVTRVDYDLPLDPADYLTGETDTFTHDAASRVNTTGYTYDARGRLIASPRNTFSWDGATRLTSTSDATLTYNGLNDLLTREANGTTLHGYYNYALGLKPMVAEKNDDTTAWVRFYVLTPGGRLLYMIDAADGNKVYFYHFDKMGNTLFLTDASGTITDKYAYSPYGKLLAHEGSNDQPFTFVGAWQIRQEGNAGLYQMRARYYDAVTARFISRESLWPRVGRPIALNPYQYAALNPLKYADRTGNDFGEPNNDIFEFGEGEIWGETANGGNLLGAPDNDLHEFADHANTWRDLDDGGSLGVPDNDMWEYEEKEDSWGEVASGGSLEAPDNDMWEYGEDDNTWQKVPGGSLGVPKNDLWIYGQGGTSFQKVGGGGLEVPKNDLWEYGEDDNTWQRVPARHLGKRKAAKKLSKKLPKSNRIGIHTRWKGSAHSLKLKPLRLHR